MMRPLRMGVRASEGLRASVRDPATLASPLPVDTPPEVRRFVDRLVGVPTFT